jgi:energy-coupling factor transporter transmembrane protein EcfT
MTIFRYQRGASIAHNTNAVVKLCLLLALSCGTPFASEYAHKILLLAAVLVLSGFSRYCGIGFAAQIKEARPFLLYLAFLYAVQAAPIAFSLLKSASFSYAALLLPSRKFYASFFLIVILAQSSQLFYKTTTSIELKDALEAIEKKLSGKTRFSRAFAVYVSFIPAVFEAWNRLDLAWRARQGRGGLQKAAVLVPSFFSLCLNAAWHKERALRHRS